MHWLQSAASRQDFIFPPPFYAWRDVKSLLFVVLLHSEAMKQSRNQKKKKQKSSSAWIFVPVGDPSNEKVQMFPYIDATSNSCKLLLLSCCSFSSELLNSSLLRGIINNDWVSWPFRGLWIFPLNDKKCGFFCWPQRGIANLSSCGENLKRGRREVSHIPKTLDLMKEKATADWL